MCEQCEDETWQLESGYAYGRIALASLGSLKAKLEDERMQGLVSAAMQDILRVLAELDDNK